MDIYTGTPQSGSLRICAPHAKIVRLNGKETSVRVQGEFRTIALN